MKDEVKKFINYQTKLTRLEAGCVIVEEGENATHVMHELMMGGFEAAHSLESLLHILQSGKNVFWHYHPGADFGHVYELICQYPNGNIEIYDAKTNKKCTAKDVAGAFVLVISAQNIEKLAREGFDVLSRVGMNLRV